MRHDYEKGQRPTEREEEHSAQSTCESTVKAPSVWHRHWFWLREEKKQPTAKDSNTVRIDSHFKGKRILQKAEEKGSLFTLWKLWKCRILNDQSKWEGVVICNKEMREILRKKVKMGYRMPKASSWQDGTLSDFV